MPYPTRYWYFEGQEGGQYSVRSIQAVFHQSLERSGVDAYATPHTQRHAYATHLLDAGVDLRHIQEAQGHNSIKTTEIYTHLMDTNPVGHTPRRTCPKVSPTGRINSGCKALWIHWIFSKFGYTMECTQ